jgi:nucleotide-binding universal stress UspA family protein
MIGGRTIERILVALDASAESHAAIAAAANLAARLQAQLVGLFIEDVKLFEVAQLSVVRQVSFTGEPSPPPDAETIERGLRAQATTMRRTLETLAASHHLTWSFQTARGRASHEILASAAKSDLVILGKTTPAVTRRGALGATARVVAERPKGAILFSDPRLSRVLGEGGATMAVYDLSPTADRALDLAAALAEAGGREIIVLTPAESDAEARSLLERAHRLLAGRPLQVLHRICTGRGSAALTGATLAHSGNLLVIGEGSPVLGTESLADLLERLHSPVLVVGAQP